MLDRVESNIQSLGALVYAVDTAARDVARASMADHIPSRREDAPSGPVVIDGVVEPTTAFHQNPADIPFEINNDDKVIDRAWRFPYQGGPMDIAQSLIHLDGAERALQANARVIHTIEQVTGSILDLRA